MKINKKIVIAILSVVILVSLVGVYGWIKPLPEGVAVQSRAYKNSQVEFLYDLSYQKNGEQVHQQQIFNKVFDLIEEAEETIIVDMFLFNKQYANKYSFPELSGHLTEKLINKKQNNPELNIFFITDNINNFYGSYEAENLKKLRNNNIEVIMTDMTKARDSNPIYSGMWRLFFRWFGTAGEGWLTNPFNPDGPKVTLRAYLKLLNFKANHRKVIVTDKEAVVTSANPHDASAYHSNIAFLVKGPIIKEIVKSEKKVAAFSGKTIDFNYQVRSQVETNEAIVSLLTEKKIKTNILQAINSTKEDEQIKIGMFYLSDRDIIKALLDAANRNVCINLILDPNRDAFGRVKNGIPNRVVAYELFKKSNGKIKIRWYDTHGEQFHTKLIFIKKKNHSLVFGGSANLTRRNLDNYNLEADLKIRANNDTQFVQQIDQYFQRIWNNQNGHYTVKLNKYSEKSSFKKIIYRVQEWSGLSTF